jgi:hypothetical protein
VIAEIVTYADYIAFLERLREAHFTEDTGEKPLTCRWHNGTLTLDVLALNQEVLGFTNIGVRLYNLPVFAGFVRTSLALAFLGSLECLAAPQQASTPKGQATAMAGPETKRDVPGDLATIIQSRSTNRRAYKVVIHNDGSATAELDGAGVGLGSEPEPSRPQQFPPGTVDTDELRRLLEDIGDVSRIPTGGCMKSASFGRRTQIAYAGKTSGDLQCVQRQASGDDPVPLQSSRDLGRLVETTLSRLKIDDRRISPNQ